MAGRIVDQLDLDTCRLFIAAVFISSSKSEGDSKLDICSTSNLLEHSTCCVEHGRTEKRVHSVAPTVDLFGQDDTSGTYSTAVPAGSR
jgi:hypothetical protein